MTGREWRAGDLVAHPRFGTGVVVQWSCHQGGMLHVHSESGSWDTLGDWSRVVVIDPEDREQVERLCGVLASVLDEGLWTSHVQAALREFADPKPPKPDEPTGLGAVVEDESGELWIRTCEPCDRCLNKPWQQGPVHKNWQIVDAVHVLSEGVQP